MKIIDRAALSRPVLTGICREHLGGLIEELADPWLAQQESRLPDRRGGRDRLRAGGTGPDHALPFVDRVIATLVILRFQLPHAALEDAVQAVAADKVIRGQHGPRAGMSPRSRRRARARLSRSALPPRRVPAAARARRPRSGWRR